MEEIKCPYCDFVQYIDHTDGEGYAPNVIFKQLCPKCDKYFAFEVEIIFDYEVFKADCLNDGKHIWKPTRTYPVKLTMMECTMCREQRKPTEEEMALIIQMRGE